MLIPESILKPFGVQGWPKPLEMYDSELVYPYQKMLVYRDNSGRDEILIYHGSDCDCDACLRKAIRLKLYQPA